MTYRVTYIDPAERDIEHAFHWYAQQSSAAAENFLARVSHVDQLLAQMPLIYPIARHEIRRAYLRPFRYGLYFRVVDDEVIVIACLHTSRRPHSIWRILSSR